MSDVTSFISNELSISLRVQLLCRGKGSIVNLIVPIADATFLFSFPFLLFYVPQACPSTNTLPLPTSQPSEPLTRLPQRGASLYFLLRTRRNLAAIELLLLLEDMERRWPGGGRAIGSKLGSMECSSSRRASREKEEEEEEEEESWCSRRERERRTRARSVEVLPFLGSCVGLRSRMYIMGYLRTCFSTFVLESARTSVSSVQNT